MKRTLKLGTYSVVLSLAAILAAVFLNIGFSYLPSSVKEIDVSGTDLITLTDQSVLIAETLKTDVTLMHVVQKGAEDSTIASLLKRYEEAGERISVETIDPDEHPMLSREYGIDTLYNNSVIVKSDIRSIYIPYPDIYVTTIVYSQTVADDPQEITTFEGEKVLTSAIHNVSKETLPKAYYLTNHGEMELEETYRQLIAGLNIETGSLSLSTVSSVPDDCSFLIVLAPEKDLNESEAEKLSAYLRRGGKIFLLTLPTVMLDDTAERTNFGKLAAEFGLSEKPGIVIEADGNYYLSGVPEYFLIPDMEPHATTAPLITNHYSVLLPYSGALAANETGSVTQTPLMTTSRSAYLKTEKNPESIEKAPGDETGPFTLAYIAERDEGAGGTLLWIASPYLPNSTCDTYSNGANYDLFRNMLTYLAGEEDTIAIGVKTIDRTTLSLSALQGTVWTVVLIAAAVLMAAAGVFVLIRRNRK